MAEKKKMNPALEKREEKEHKDLDHDGEKGEPLAHREKVLGKKKADKKTDKKADAAKGDKKDEKKEFKPFTRPAPKPSEKNKKK